LSLSALELLSHARRTLAEAAEQGCPPDRYAGAHLAALRGAAAVLAARCESPGAKIRRRPTSAWVLLRSMAPELTEWAGFFATSARRRAAAEAGAPGAVTAREADDLVREVESFLAVVETTLGLPGALGLPGGLGLPVAPGLPGALSRPALGVAQAG
jgi:hypothetical protein